MMHPQTCFRHSLFYVLILSYQPPQMTEAETVSVIFDTVSMLAVEDFFAHNCRESF